MEHSTAETEQLTVVKSIVCASVTMDCTANIRFEFHNSHGYIRVPVMKFDFV
jgi:hypothetical protein